MNIQETIDALIGREGKYSNNANDRGGETMWGITVGNARAFGYTGDMSAMPRLTAINIYTDRYWLHPHLDEVSTVDPFIAEELLDTGVNMGPVVAGTFLQRALNALNYDGLWQSLTQDGSIGALTIYALKQFLALRGVPGRTVLLRMLNAQQSVRYIELCEANATQKTFIFGWQLNRVGGTYGT